MSKCDYEMYNLKSYLSYSFSTKQDLTCFKDELLVKYLAEMKRFECWEWVVMVRSEWVGGRKCINSFEVYSGFKWDQIYYKILNVNPIIPI